MRPGIDSPALFRPSNTTWYFRYTNSQGVADETIVWGESQWLPVAGMFGPLVPDPTTTTTTSTTLAIPPNPGDTKNCSDFATWQEALEWFLTYFPYYGDIAKLDADGDGIACESLPGAPG